MGTIEPESLNALEDSEWKEYEFAVIGEDVLKAVKKIDITSVTCTKCYEKYITCKYRAICSIL